MKNLIRACGLLTLAVPLLAFAWPARAEARSAPEPAAVPTTGPQQVAPVPCRCRPFVVVMGPFGCKCPFDLLVSAMKPGQCTPANAAPPCDPITPCKVNVRLFWVGEEDDCGKPPRPQLPKIHTTCGTFVPRLYFCPAGPGLVTVFLHCRKCKP